MGTCWVFKGDYVRLTDLDVETFTYPSYFGESATLHFSRSDDGSVDATLTLDDSVPPPSLNEKLVGRRVCVELWKSCGSDDAPAYSYFREVFMIVDISGAELTMGHLAQ